MGERQIDMLSEEKNKIRKFIVDNFLFGDESISLKDDVSFLETGTVDSTGMLELIAFVENEFKIPIGNDELNPENLDSINNIASFIYRKKGGNV